MVRPHLAMRLPDMGHPHYLKHYHWGVLTPEHSFEWLKILVSTLSGLFVGLIAEPIKSTIQRKIEIVRMERAIGMDCLRILVATTSSKVGLVNDPTSFWKVEMLPAYQHYWASKRELFYVDFDLQIIQINCWTIEVVRDSVLEGRIDPAEALAKTEVHAKAILEVRQGKKGLGPRVRSLLLRLVT